MAWQFHRTSAALQRVIVEGFLVPRVVTIALSGLHLPGNGTIGGIMVFIGVNAGMQQLQLRMARAAPTFLESNTNIPASSTTYNRQLEKNPFLGFWHVAMCFPEGGCIAM